MSLALSYISPRPLPLTNQLIGSHSPPQSQYKTQQNINIIDYNWSSNCSPSAVPHFHQPLITGFVFKTIPVDGVTRSHLARHLALFIARRNLPSTAASGACVWLCIRKLLRSRHFRGPHRKANTVRSVFWRSSLPGDSVRISSTNKSFALDTEASAENRVQFLV